MKCYTKPFNPCPQGVINAKCVAYTGANLTTIGVTTNDRLDVILEKINEAIQDPFFNIFIEDTVTLNLSGDGTSSTPLFGDVNLSSSPGNAITILSDGLFVDAGTGGSGLVSGGIITWLQDYDYSASPANYFINDLEHNSPYTEVTLAPSDPLLNRVDVIAVDNTGTVIVITGDPAEEPLAPSIDPETQLLLSFVIVEANTTQPNINQEWIYRENIEWATLPTAITVDPTSTSNPYAGSLDVEATNPTNGQGISFTAPSPIGTSSYNVLNFRIRVKTAFPTGSGLTFRFYSEASAVGNSITLVNGLYGFSATTIGAYQNISIPLASFNLPSSINKLLITQSQTSNGWYIDDIQLQESFVPTGTGDFILNQQAFNQLANYRISGTGTNGKLLVGTTAFSASTFNAQINGNLFMGGSSPIIQWTASTLTMNALATNGRLLLNSQGTGSAFEIQHSRENGQMLTLYNSQNSEASKLRFAAKTTASLTSNGFTSTQGINGYYFSHNLTNSPSSWTVGDVTKNAYLEFYPHITGTSTSLIKLEALRTSSTYKEIEHITAATRYISPQGNHRVIIGSSTDDGTTPLQIDGIIKARSYGVGAVTGTATYNLLVDTDGNIIEGAVPVGGGILGITADNGLTATSSTNVQLGGLLLADTTINGNTIASGARKLIIQGEASNLLHIIHTTSLNTALRIETAGSGMFIRSTSAGGTGIWVDSDGVGGRFKGDVLAGAFEHTGSNTNTVEQVLQISRSSGAANVGIGSRISWNVQGITSDAMYQDMKYTNVTAGTLRTQYDLSLQHDSGAPVLRETLYSTGQKQLTAYGSGIFTGTPAYTLQVDASGNIIEGSVAAGASSITADNGLTKSTSTNIQLGATASGANSPLLHNTFINTTASYYLEVNGSTPFSTAQGILRVTNTSGSFNYAGNFVSTNGAAIHASGATGVFAEGTITGVQGAAVSGVAVRGDDSGAGVGIIGSSIDGLAGNFFIQPSTDSTVASVLQLSRFTTGTSTNGIGGSINLFTELDDGVGYETNSIISKATDVTFGSYTSQFIITGVDNAVIGDILTLNGNKSLQFNGYGVNAFTGTPAYALAVDASGNVIEIATAGGTDQTFANTNLTATGNRSHDFTDAYSLTIGGTTSFDLFVGDIALGGDFSGVFSAGGVTYLEHFIDSSTTSAVVAVENALTRMQVTTSGDVSTLELTPNTLTINSTNATDFQMFVEDLATAATANVLFYDTTTGQITYGATPGGGGGGTVTSVAASITAGAVAIAGSPITSSGTLAFTYTGTTAQYIRGDGSLQTFPTTISGITADSGLSTSSSTNVRLGGSALVANTTIPTSAFSLSIASTNSTRTFRAENTDVGIALEGSSSNGTAIYGAGAIGIHGYTNSGTSLKGYTELGLPLELENNTTATNTIVRTALFSASSSNTVANGFGNYAEFGLETVGGGITTSNQIISKWTTAATATRTSQFIITGVNSAVTADLLTLSGSGSLRLNKYGVNTFSGTPAYALGTDSSGNIIEFAAGTLSGITADNGLTANTPSNTRLGGSLLQDTTITGGAFKLTLTSTIGAGTSTGTLVVNNTSSGQAIYATASTATAVRGEATSSGIGLFGVSSSGVGVQANSTSGVALQSYSVSSRAFAFSVEPSSTNTVVDAGRISRLTSGTAADGIGASLDFFVETSTSGSISNRIISKWTTAADATRTSQLILTGVNSATTADLFTLSGSGALRLNKYGVSTFSGSVAYLLAVDTSGNVIETPVAGGGSANTALSNLVSVSINSSLLFNTDNIYDIGSAANGVKDIYARTLRLDGSTSGTVVLNAPATAGSNTVTLPAATGTVALLQGNQTFSGLLTLSGGANFSNANIYGYTAATRTITGTTDTLTSADSGKVLRYTSNSSITLTVPTGLPVGFNCTIIQLGTGQITFSASGTTIVNRQSFTKTAGQYAVGSIVSHQTDLFVTSGDLAV